MFPRCWRQNPPHAPGVGRTSLFRALFRIVFFPFFPLFSAPFQFHFWSFSLFFASSFRAWILHRFFIAFGIDFHVIFHVFLMIFPFAHSPRTKPREPCFWTTLLCSALRIEVLPFRKNMKFHDFPDPFRYQFWHCFLMSFGIGFGSLLGAFWCYFRCFSAIDFWRNCWLHFEWIWIKNGSKTGPKSIPGIMENLYFSRNPPKIDFGMHFDRPLAHFGHPSGSDCFVLGSRWLTLSSDSLPSGILWLPFAPPRVPLPRFCDPQTFFLILSWGSDTNRKNMCFGITFYKNQTPDQPNGVIPKSAERIPTDESIFSSVYQQAIFCSFTQALQSDEGGQALTRQIILIHMSVRSHKDNHLPSSLLVPWTGKDHSEYFRRISKLHNFCFYISYSNQFVRSYHMYVYSLTFVGNWRACVLLPRVFHASITIWWRRSSTNAPDYFYYYERSQPQGELLAEFSASSANVQRSF